MKRVGFNLDMLGVCASSLCMIHCIVFPLLLLLLPFVPTLSAERANDNSVARAGQSEFCLEEECCPSEGSSAKASVGNGHAACCATPADFWIHVGLLATVAPLGLVAWGAGYRQHGYIGVLLLGGAGVALLSGALLFGHHLFFGRGEQVMTVAGSVCMVTAHLWNRQRCHCCRSLGVANVVEIESRTGISEYETA